MGKKVLVFCGGSFVFGAEIVTLSVLEVFRANGVEVHCIVSGWNDGDFIKRLDTLGFTYTIVKLGFIYVKKPLWTLDTLIHYPKAMLSVKTVIKTFKPDFLHHVNYRTVIATYPLTRKLKNYVFIFDPHYGALNKKYFKILNRVVFLYVSVSNAIKQNLIEIGAKEEKIKVIHNGIKILPNVVQKPLTGIITFGIIGQIIPRKGHEHLIEALKILKETQQGFKLSIIGKGDTEFIAKLKYQIQLFKLEKHVNFINFIPDRDQLYNSVDVVLVPSITSDPLPTTAMEAGLYYKPTIVSDIGGLPEIVIQNKTGLIITPNVAKELADAMEQFILKKALIREYGICAHQHIVQNFSVERNILTLVNLLNQPNVK